MGMQTENRVIEASKLSEYCGQKWDTFYRATKTVLGTYHGRKSILVDEQVDKMCIHFEKRPQLAPTGTISDINGARMMRTEYPEPTSEGSDFPDEDRSALEEKLKAMKVERDEYRNALTDLQLKTESEKSGLSEKSDRLESEIRKAENRISGLESELSAARDKYEAYVLESSDKVASATLFAQQFQINKAELSQAKATEIRLQEEIELLRITLEKSRKGLSGLTLKDAINGISMLIFIGAGYEVADWLGCGVAIVAALLMVDTIWNMKTSVSDAARLYGFRVCCLIEGVAGFTAFNAFFKILGPKDWLPFDPSYMAIGAAAFLSIMSIVALLVTKKENEI
jgi:hypothetical protein